MALTLGDGYRLTDAQIYDTILALIDTYGLTPQQACETLVNNNVATVDEISRALDWAAKKEGVTTTEETEGTTTENTEGTTTENAEGTSNKNEGTNEGKDGSVASDFIEKYKDEGGDVNGGKIVRDTIGGATGLYLGGKYVAFPILKFLFTKTATYVPRLLAAAYPIATATGVTNPKTKTGELDYSLDNSYIKNSANYFSALVDDMLFNLPEYVIEDLLGADAWWKEKDAFQKELNKQKREANDKILDDYKKLGGGWLQNFFGGVLEKGYLKEEENIKNKFGNQGVINAIAQLSTYCADNGILNDADFKKKLIDNGYSYRTVTGEDGQPFQTWINVNGDTLLSEDVVKKLIGGGDNSNGKDGEIFKLSGERDLGELADGLPKTHGTAEGNDNNGEEITSDKILAYYGDEIKKLMNKNETSDLYKYGNDVTAEGGQSYLDKRNPALARHLKLNGIETAEDIDKYLSQYPSWQNAKQEWKDNTLGILVKQISELGDEYGQVKQEEQALTTEQEGGETVAEEQLLEEQSLEEQPSEEEQLSEEKVDNESPINGGTEEGVVDENQVDDESPINGEEKIGYGGKKVIGGYEYKGQIYNEYSDGTMGLANERNPSPEPLKITGGFEYDDILYNEYSDNTWGPAAERNPETKEVTGGFSYKDKLWEEYSDGTWGPAGSRDRALKMKEKYFVDPDSPINEIEEEEVAEEPTTKPGDELNDLEKAIQSYPGYEEIQTKSSFKGKQSKTTMKKGKEKTEKKEDKNDKDKKETAKKVEQLKNSPVIEGLLKNKKK